MVLALAMRGVLVPQEDDAPLMISGRQEQSLADDIGLTLPDNWIAAEFRDICQIETELVDSTNFPDSIQVGPDCIEKETGRQIEVRTVRQAGVLGPNSRFRAGHILYSKIRPTLSKVLLVDFDGLCSADMYPLRSRIDPRFQVLLMLSDVFLAQVRLAENRVKMPKLNMESLSHFVVPVPPLAEQHRIVAKVDELMALCDRLEARKQDAEAAHTRLVQVLLDSLTQARDTEEFQASWERVVGQFEVLFTTEQSVDKLWRAVLDLAANGRLVAGDAKAPQRPISALLISDTLNGCSQKPQDTADGTPILRISAATGSQDFIVDERDHKWVTLTDGELRKFRLEPNDLLACRFNGNLHYVGAFALYRGVTFADQVFPDKLIRFRVNPALALPDYVRFIMNASPARAQIESFCATTVGNIGISATNLKTVRIRVPDVQEQRRIVDLLSVLLSACSQLMAKITAARTIHSDVAKTLVSEALSVPA
jgi:type I restriction enzyme, S subunit